MHDGMPYGRNQGQGHSREVDRQSPTGLIFKLLTVSHSTYDEHLRRLGLMTLERRRLRGDLIEMYKILTGKESIDSGNFFTLHILQGTNINCIRTGVI